MTTSCLNIKTHDFVRNHRLFIRQRRDELLRCHIFICTTRSFQFTLCSFRRNHDPTIGIDLSQMEKSQKRWQIRFIQLRSTLKWFRASTPIWQLLVPQALHFVERSSVFKDNLDKLGFLSCSEPIEFPTIHQFKKHNRILIIIANRSLDLTYQHVHFAGRPIVADFDVKKWFKIIDND